MEDSAAEEEEAEEVVVDPAGTHPRRRVAQRPEVLARGSMLEGMEPVLVVIVIAPAPGRAPAHDLQATPHALAARQDPAAARRIAAANRASRLRREEELGTTRLRP